MTFRAFAFPNDGRMHREEDLTAARLAFQQQRGARSLPPEGSITPGEQKAEGLNDPASPTPSPQPERRNVVIPDPVSFHRYIGDDSLVTTVKRSVILRGYELYLVEQWVCSRESPALVIVTHTGDERHSVTVGVVGIPTDKSIWSLRLQKYFQAVEQYHARPKETPHGEIIVTNLSSFPSALTVIPVPEGNIKKYRHVFTVNEDLKRLGCSGRSGLTLSTPIAATQAKFHQLFKTSERIPFMEAVVDLVMLCQLSLVLFGKLNEEYADGLLCDKTETAIGDWWTELGAEYYNIEPTDGILGPTTVAALLGMLMGARNRLHWLGYPVAKDAFDIENTRRGISQFQKAYKLHRTKSLDRQTLLRLHQVTAKAAAGEGWGVQKAVKSTVAEIGGKRGEMVIGMVGGRDKAGIGDIETLDIDKFISLAYGEQAKYLWQGKPKRSATDHHDRTPDVGHILFGKDDSSAPGLRRALVVSVQDEVERRKDESIYSAPPPGSTLSMLDSPSEKDASRKTVFKSVAGSVASNTRSGFGRIKDAVGGGLRGHVSRPSKDDSPESGFSSPSISALAQTSTGLSSPGINRAFTWRNKPEEYMAALRGDKESEFPPGLAASVADSERTAVDSRNGQKPAGDSVKGKQFEGEFNEMEGENRKETLLLAPPSVGVSAVEDSDAQDPLLEAEHSSNAPPRALQRRKSIEYRRPPNENRWPRRISFSDAEEAVLRWEEIAEISIDEEDLDTPDRAQRNAHLAEVARSLYQSIAIIKDDIEPWVLEKLAGIEALDYRFAQDQDELQKLYYQYTEAYQANKTQSAELVESERALLMGGLKEVEVFVARLEYEINALVSKVGDVEDGVIGFEKQVEDLERRAEELKVQLETESWLHWFVRTLTGIGTGPNITRPRPK